MKNNYFSISKYVEENSFNYLHNEPYLLEDFSINEHDDSSDNLQQNESEENLDNFSEINKIMNPKPNSDFDEKEEEGEEEEEKIYFLNKKEKNSSFLGHKRNNNDSILEENQPIEKNIQVIPVELKKDKKETKASTGEPSNNKIKKNLFLSNQKIYRNDYLIKKFKVSCFSDYSKDELNHLLKECEFSKELKLNKIYGPNNKAFTSIDNLKKNKEFLPLKISNIFSMQNGNGQYQIKNGENFITILNSKDHAGNIEAYEDLIKFLNLTAEEVINKYYASQEFENFKSKSEIIAADNTFFKEKKFSLLQNRGFIKLIKGDY